MVRHSGVVVANGVAELIAVGLIDIRKGSQVVDFLLTRFPFLQLLCPVLHHLVVCLGPFFGCECLLLRSQFIQIVRRESVTACGRSVVDCVRRSLDTLFTGRVKEVVYVALVREVLTVLNSVRKVLDGIGVGCCPLAIHTLHLVVVVPVKVLVLCGHGVGTSKHFVKHSLCSVNLLSVRQTERVSKVANGTRTRIA